MNGNFAKTALTLATPFSLLLAGVLLSAKKYALPLPEGVLVDYLPFALAGAGAIFGVWFKRPRVIYPLALIALAHWTLLTFVPAAPGAGVMGQVVYAALAVMLPLNLLIFAFAGEVALFSLRALSRMALILIQVVAVIVAVDLGAKGQGTAAALLHARIFPPSFDAWTYLPQPAILIFAFASLVLAVRLAVVRKVLDYAMLGALAAAALALHTVGRGAQPSMFFAFGGLALVLGAIQDVYRMAYVDELTGLPGRRALTAAMKGLAPRYVIAMADVDYFKKFNDTYGHDAGDQVLKMVAARLKGVGGGGRPFRYGGEEFTVLFPSKTADQAVDHLEALRRSVEGAGFALRGNDRPEVERRTKSRRNGPLKKVSVTISIGLAGPENNDQTPDDVLKAADKALYRAKDAGRNKVSG